MIPIAITGASGRMGQRLIALARESGQFDTVATLNRGQQLPSSANPKVLIDFSAPESTRQWLTICHQRKIAMLIGTTGLSKADHAAIDQAARDIAILQASNTSLGIAVLKKVVANVAQKLGSGFDIEIVEAHHRFKKDAPSGTAITLAEAINEVTKTTEMPIHSLRLGDEIGRHTVYFASLGERLEFTHVATDRDTFARGALRAAEWLVGQTPGRYDMSDVLGV